MENPGETTGTAELENLARLAEAAGNYQVCSIQTKRKVKHMFCGQISQIYQFLNKWEILEFWWTPCDASSFSCRQFLLTGRSFTCSKLSSKLNIKAATSISVQTIT